MDACRHSFPRPRRCRQAPLQTPAPLQTGFRGGTPSALAMVPYLSVFGSHALLRLSQIPSSTRPSTPCPRRTRRGTGTSSTPTPRAAPSPRATKRWTRRAVLRCFPSQDRSSVHLRAREGLPAGGGARPPAGRRSLVSAGVRWQRAAPCAGPRPCRDICRATETGGGSVCAADPHHQRHVPRSA